jgi:hypothetical protein
MATVAYRPELENPSREGAISFALMDESKLSMTTISLEPGVNRKVDDQAWETLKATESVKALIKIGAIEELKARTASEGSDKGDVQRNNDLGDVLGLSVPDAMKVVDASFDETFLGRWKTAEGRSTVINKINQRLRSLKAGEG